MVVMFCTHLNVESGTGGSQTDVVGHGHIDAVDARVVEEVAQHQLTLLRRLHHVTHRVKGPQALGIQNHTAHLFRMAGGRQGDAWVGKK